jgi:putative phosphoribosyl transferase
MGQAIFADRMEAGRTLAGYIEREFPGDWAHGRLLVLAIPRGGVVLGAEVAKALDAELDLVVPRKLGAQNQPEFALGAVMGDGTVFLNQDSVRMTGATREYVEAEKARQMAEAKRRLEAYRGGRPEPKISGRTVVVVDDGVATGATMIVALRWVRSKGARRVVAATPLAPASTLAELKDEADLVVCPNTPEPFYAIGSFYERFEQVTDDEVRRTLQEFWRS